MNDYRLVWFENGDWQNITPFVSDVSLTDAVDMLSVELSFNTAKNTRDRYMPGVNISPGEKIALYNGENEIFAGIVITSDTDGGVDARDYGYYLNQSQIILQCNGIRADEAVHKMCSKTGVPVGKIANMPTLVTENYIGETPSNILDSILEKTEAETGTRYLYRVKNGALYVQEYPAEQTKAYVQLASNLSPMDIFKEPGIVAGTQSMEAMRNEVSVISEESENARVLAVANDQTSIAKFGWLQHIEKVTELNQAQAKNMASVLLVRLNKLSEQYNISDMLGCDSVTSGVKLNFDLENIKGDFIVRQVTHNYFPTHTMKIEVNRV